MPQEGGVVCGHSLPGGTYLPISQLAAKMSTRSFLSPATFAPSRWREDEKFGADKLDTVQLFSFGPRNCIGKNFALFQIRLILTHIFWNFEIEPVEQTDMHWNDQKAWATWHRVPLIVRLLERRLDLLDKVGTSTIRLGTSTFANI